MIIDDAIRRVPKPGKRILSTELADTNSSRDFKTETRQYSSVVMRCMEKSVCRSFFSSLALVVAATAQTYASSSTPQLRVCVYSSDDKKPIHGAIVEIRDAWLLNADSKSATGQTGPNGRVTFKCDDFMYWRVHTERFYKGQCPWDWIANPAHLVGVTEGTRGRTEQWSAVEYGRFKARIEVKTELCGVLERFVEWVHVENENGFEAVFYCTSKSKSPRRRTSGLGEVRRSVTSEFSLSRPATVEIAWPSGMPAVRAVLSHTGITRPQSPNGYGLWLQLFALHDQGRETSGQELFLLGDPANGLRHVREGEKRKLQYGDISIEFELSPFRWNAAPKAGHSGSFDGTLWLTAYLAVAEEAPLPQSSPQVSEADLFLDQLRSGKWAQYPSGPHYLMLSFQGNARDLLVILQMYDKSSSESLGVRGRHEYRGWVDESTTSPSIKFHRGNSVCSLELSRDVRTLVWKCDSAMEFSRE